MGATFHCCAAACTSISRAAAPARRSESYEVRTLWLPKTPCIPPYSRLTPGNSVRTFFQSHSSSSASNCEREVTVPCPISALWMKRVTESSVPTCTKAFSLFDVVAPLEGREKPRNSPLAAAAPARRKLRREKLVVAGALISHLRHDGARRPDGRRGGCPDRCRNGRCCCASLRRYRRLWGWLSSPAARRQS